MALAQIEVERFFEHRLQILPYSVRLLDRPKSDAALGDQAAMVQQYSALFLSKFLLTYLESCCIASRFFTDLLHDRAVLDFDDIAGWAKPFLETVAKLEAAFPPGKASASVRGRFSDSEWGHLEGCLMNIFLRGVLVQKLADGHDITQDLIAASQADKRRDLAVVIRAGKGGTKLSKVLPADAISDPEWFLFWMATRFLGHKLHYLSVELGHEVGPEWRSIRDHLTMATKAHEFATDLWTAATAGRAASEGRSPQAASLISWGKDLLARFQTSVIDSLQNFRLEFQPEADEYAAAEEAPGIGRLDQLAKKKVQSVSIEVGNLWIEVAAKESSLAGAAPPDSREAWRAALATATKVRFGGELLFTPLRLPADLPTDSARDDYLASILTPEFAGAMDESDGASEAISSSRFDTPDHSEALAAWTRWVVASARDLMRPVLPPEEVATLLFGKLAAGHLGLAFETLRHTALEAPPRARFALGPVLLHWSGILLGQFSRQPQRPWRAAVGDEAWWRLALDVAKRKGTPSLDESMRCSLGAVLFAISVLAMSDQPGALESIRDRLRLLLAVTPEDERAYILQHVVDTLADYFPAKDDSASHWRLCGLHPLIGKATIRWPEDSPLLDAIRRACTRFQGELQQIGVVASAGG